MLAIGWLKRSQRKTSSAIARWLLEKLQDLLARLLVETLISKLSSNKRGLHWNREIFLMLWKTFVGTRCKIETNIQ